MSAKNGGAKNKNLLLIELNEFNPDFLKAAADQFELRHISRMLSFNHARTDTMDKVEHQGLDPWVQWVGIHTGLPSTEHGIKRLGLTKSQNRQIWHALAEAGFTWGVWGAMNAPLGTSEGCAFFMPDPWSFDERAYPPELNALLDLPRYTSKNYLDLDWRAMFRKGLRFIGYLMKPARLQILARFMKEALCAVLRAGANVHTFTTLLDYLSVLVFQRLRERDRPDFSLIFLNHIAHLQHHFWLADGKIHPQMKLGLQLCDAMLGVLLPDEASDDAVVVVNGLKQINVDGRGFCCYRQKNPADALRRMGIHNVKVEQCMTHDAHLVFDNRRDADRAEHIIASAVLSTGKAVFNVERLDERSLFYQIDFEDEVPLGSSLTVGGIVVRFDDIFEFVVERTGAHISEGDIYSRGFPCSSDIQNHDLFQLILDYFGLRAQRAWSAQAPLSH